MEILKIILTYSVAAFIISVQSGVIKVSNVALIQDRHLPVTHLTEQLELDKDESEISEVEKFQLMMYLPKTQEKNYCRAISKAIQKNVKLEGIEKIHLFRHKKSCIGNQYLPLSSKIQLHQIYDDEVNMTFIYIMKFIAKECENKNVILAKANMYFTSDINVFVHAGIHKGEVYILKSEHPTINHQTDGYYGTHYAFVFKGQWDLTDDYPRHLEGSIFELDSRKLDNEEVLKKMFEINLGMILHSSDAKAICLH